MSVVIDRDGRPVSYEAAVNLMDDELRELLHANLAPCSEQEFSTPIWMPTASSMAKSFVSIERKE